MSQTRWEHLKEVEARTIPAEWRWFVAGAMSDDRHNRHLLKAKQEELQAKKAAVKFLGDSDQATMEVRDLRERSRALLERPEVRAMVDALAGAVLKRETSSGDEALYVMLSASGDT